MSNDCFGTVAERVGRTVGKLYRKMAENYESSEIVEATAEEE